MHAIQVDLVNEAFKSLRAVVLTASACTKPDQKSFADLLDPLRKSVASVVQVPEKHRKERVWYNHFQVLTAAIPSVGWVESVCQSFIILYVYNMNAHTRNPNQALILHR